MFGKKKEKLAVEPWLENDEAFLKHFDISHADFMTLLDTLGEDYGDKYESIYAVHPEAAVLWLIHEGKQHGIVKTVA